MGDSLSSKIMDKCSEEPIWKYLHIGCNEVVFVEVPGETLGNTGLIAE